MHALLAGVMTTFWLAHVHKWTHNMQATGLGKGLRVWRRGEVLLGGRAEVFITDIHSLVGNCLRANAPDIYATNTVSSMRCRRRVACVRMFFYRIMLNASPDRG